jgi:membrane-bound metal-dependent hydrolase YbcI (DUF457 family)
VFFFAHLGFTAAPGALISTWWGENRGFVSRAPDLRWLLAGAVLPDIIDKAVGEVLFKPYFENGRIFAHTFALSLLLLVAGTYSLKRRGDSRILLLACGVAGHLVLDRMWTEAATAWWPAMGPFLRYPSQGTIIEQIMEYLRDPMFWSTEIAGIALLAISLRYLGVKNRRTLKAFLANGVSPSLTRYELHPLP